MSRPRVAPFLAALVGAAPLAAAPPAPCPTTFEMAGEMSAGASRSCLCPHGPLGGAVFGSGRYGPASWICDAALHAGARSRPGETVTFYRQAECARLWGSEANGVVAVNRGAPTPTFSFTPAPPPCPPPPSTDAGLQPCPAGARSGLESRPPGTRLDCTCAYKRRRAGVAWGRDVYAIFSDVCDAAQHAGAVDPKGSAVTVFLGGPCDRFAGSSRNGIETSRWDGPARGMAFRLPFPPCPGEATPR